jgi:hypothetical protein
MKRALAVLALLTFGALFTPVANAAALPGQLALPRAHRLALMAPAPLAATSASTYAISGTAEDLSGQPLAHYAVDWGWYDPGPYAWWPWVTYNDGDETHAAADGSFSFPAVTSHPGQDALMAATSDVDVMVLWRLDFSTTSHYLLRPAHVAVSMANAPTNEPLSVDIGDPASSYASSHTTLSHGAGVVNAVAPDFTSAVAFYDNWSGRVMVECQWISPNDAPVAVAPGALASTPVSFDWKKAIHGHLLGPVCQHSGRPGSLVRYGVSNLPAGEQMSFFGQSQWPLDWGLQSYSTVLTSGGADKSYSVSLRIPRRATVGQTYTVYATRSDDSQSMLGLCDYYNVCTFGASRSVILRGGIVRLRGQTAVSGNDIATLFMRHTSAGVPSSAKAPGWTKVATYGLDASGNFHSSLLRPSRTTWYVVRYWYGVTSFTPVVRVVVR